MNSNWKTKELGEVCDFYGGLWKGKKPPFIHVGVIRNTNITKEGSLDDTDIAYLDVERKQYEKRKLRYGDIVLEKSGGGPKQPVGRVIVFDKTKGDFSFSNFTSAIRIKDPAVLDFNFLHKFLYDSYISGVTEAMQSHSTGLRNLDLHAYKRIEIPLPPLIQQKQIANTLDHVIGELEMAKEIAEKNLLNSKRLFGSYIQSVFAQAGKYWKIEALKDICDFQNGFAFKSTSFTKEGEPVLRISNIQNGGVSYKRIVFFNKTSYKENLDKYRVSKGDLLIAMSGATTGKVAISDADETFYLNQRVGKFLPKATLLKEYLYFFLSTKIEENLMISAGSAQPNLSTEQIKNIEIPLPDLSAQKILVRKMNMLLAETRTLEVIYRQKLSNIEELKRSVLKKAFSGEISTPPISRSTPVTTAGANVPSPYIRNQVHAAIIDQVSRDGGWTTEVAVAKYDHLLQEVFGLPLGYEFQTHQFGPFDAKIKRLVSSGLNGNKWFTKRNGMIVFGSNIRGLLFRQSNLYRNAQAIMGQLSGLGITKMEAEKVELLSTVCHSMKETDSVALDNVRDFMSRWQTDNNRTKAEKFTTEQTQKCLDFIIRNNLHQRLLQTT